MSRDQIKPLLSAIFSEPGLIEWILRFDDYPDDLIRRLCPQNWPRDQVRCLRCELKKNKGQFSQKIHQYFLPTIGSPCTFCDENHLEIPISPGIFWSFSPIEHSFVSRSEAGSLEEGRLPKDSDIVQLKFSLQCLEEA